MERTINQPTFLDNLTSDLGGRRTTGRKNSGANGFIRKKTTFLSVRIMVINLVQLELSKKENNVKIVFYCERNCS